jgi:hypothetical protein
MNTTNPRLLRSRMVWASALLSVLASASVAGAVTREEALVSARSYANHKWTSGQANTTASCSAAYKSLYIPGDYVGVAYNWGGYMSIGSFDQLIAGGQGAGAQEPDGILSCTAGVDCSGFVSMAWRVGRFTTASMAQTSAAISQAEMLPADIFNKASFHVAMQAATKANGEPLFIEALGYNVNVNSTGGFSHVAGFTPRRLNGITDSPVTDPVGTSTKPIVIPSFPYSDQRNTKLSPSAVFDTCAVDTTKNVKGPEYFYLAKITQPGTLTVSVQDDAATDIDVHILAGNPSPNRCVARNDTTVTMQVGCGDYYVVADTFGTGTTNAGAYTLNATFSPSGAACASVAGPPAFNPKGKLGEACAFPANKNLPFCNMNLGGETCIYSQTESFCSTPCAGDNDCGGLGAGGCCRDLGQGEKYCLKANFCGANPGVQPGTKPTPGDGSGTSSGGTSSGGTSSGGTSSGDPGEDPAADPGAAPATSSTTTSGCGVAPSGGTPVGLGGAAFALVATAAAAQRRRRRRG